METLPKLSNIQIELLKLFTTDVSDNELLDIKQLIVNYYTQKIDNELAIIWEQRQYNADTIATWATQDLRTPYKK